MIIRLVAKADATRDLISARRQLKVIAREVASVISNCESSIGEVFTVADRGRTMIFIVPQSSDRPIRYAGLTATGEIVLRMTHPGLFDSAFLNPDTSDYAAVDPDWLSLPSCRSLFKGLEQLKKRL